MKKMTILLSLFVLCGFFALHAQNVQITGTVTSAEDGLTLPGVSVVASGTSIGTVTNMDGRYSLSVPSNVQSLVFSFVGMASQTVPIQGRSVIDVEMSPDVFAIDELVVTALGISRERRSLGYAVQDVSGADIAEAKDVNLVNSLSGRVAGVQVTSGGGAVGSSSRITIRGNSSFGDNQPLFVVDGTPISNFSTAVSQYGGADYGNAIMDLDPANIESMTVLKGGMAAALYGQRAANGVIIITTKNAQQRPVQAGVNISSSVTFEDPYIFPAYQDTYGQGLNGEEFIYRRYLTNNNLTEAQYSYQNYAYDRTFRYYNGRGGGLYDGRDESWGARLDIGLRLPQFNSPYTLDANGLPVYENTPWVSNPSNTRDFFVTGATFDNSVEIYGGSGTATAARLSFSNMTSSGTIPNTDLTRNTINFSGITSVTDNLTARVNATYIKNNSDNLPGGGYDSDNVMQSIGGWFGRQVDMNALKENWETRDPFGYYYNWNQTYFSNPYFIANRMLKGRQRDRVFGNIELTYRINDWLNLMGRVGNDYFTENRKSVWPAGSVGMGLVANSGGRFWDNERSNNEFNADLFLNFDANLNSDLRIDGMVGGNYMNRTYRFMNVQANDITVPNLFTIGNVSGSPIASMFNSEVVSNSLFGTVNISYRNFLFINTTGRNDWSSTLPPDAWSYFYPSVGTSFVFTEAFGIQSDFLSYGKIRGSWAQVGKATDPYNYIGTYSSPTPGTFRGVTQFFLDRQLPPPDLKNETTTTYEAGIELSLFMNRLRFDATYYNNIVTDHIMGVDISSASGYNRMLINAGEIQNTGVELMLNGNIIRNPNGFNWNTTLNWSKSKDMVNELYGDLESYQISASWGDLTIEARPGRPYGVIMSTGFARDDQGRVIVNNAGRVLRTPVPVEIGKVTPDWIGGMRNSFSYRNINMSFLLDGRKGGDIFSVTHWFGGYAGVAAFTAEGGIRENGVVVGKDVLSQWGAVVASYDGTAIVRDADGFVVGSGVENDVTIPAQTYFMDFWGNQENSIIDGSFIKLRELTVGYDLPQNLMNRLGYVQGARISFVGRNLALLYTHESNTINIDPETGFGTTNTGVGLEQYQIPSSRSLGFRINLSF
jgi:TonB-linked SusC/RagA family outer membrane protein